MRKIKQRKKFTDARKILDRISGRDPKLRESIEEQKLNVRVAAMIHQLRESAGLNQARLADLVGTTQSVISRIEDADYEGHSLSMLQRIAMALEHLIEVKFVPTAQRR